MKNSMTKNEQPRSGWEPIRNEDRAAPLSKNEGERVRRSLSQRLMSVFWIVVNTLLPKGSRRRSLVKVMVRLLRHPLHFLKKCTPARIRKFFYVLRREGTEGVLRRISDSVSYADTPVKDIELEKLPPLLPGQQRTAADYEPLTVPTREDPLVSIVIPVFDRFEYTYLCIKSILKHSGDIPYEIILADDCSTDLTVRIDEIISGLITIHNPKNLRFLHNCNNAATFARGKYIVFLNNDTQVQKNWLAPLLELIERSDGIGMVGSKLVYPDGRLQEAGGILWSDGTAWNYGNRSDPSLPEYNYVKEVDYISGASILLRRELWNEIGGFDERFAPAYYEDTDLAFEVRRHGYKVVYQPLSVVVHAEGVTNGKDPSEGQKVYLLVNREKFCEKWKDVLAAENFPYSVELKDMFRARDRSRTKETVLVIDHYIPTYDKDAGSRSMDTYLTLLVKMGFHVLFMGDNFYYDRHYAERYEQMGIEMLCGSYYSANWKRWLKENADCLDYVFLSRPHISIKYIDFFARQKKIKIIYYVQDLHFLREEREYELTRDPALLRSAKAVKQQELYIMERSDAVFTLSDVEKTIIDREIPGERAVIVPISCYYSFPDGPVSLRGKRDIVFVGGFGHRPNEDGILWFLDEIWEDLHRELPESRLVIIGSKPTEKILARQAESVIVTGYVTDEELEEHYRNCRVCIIPLRYGAGVKGKTLEAMYHRVPIAATSVGTEGLVGIDRYIRATDDAQSFRARVKELYLNTEEAEKQAERYHEYLREHNSYETVKKIFSKVFTKAERDEV